MKDWNGLIEGYFGERAGLQLFSVSDSIDTRSAAGRLVLNVLMSVGQWEREAIGERTRDALGTSGARDSGSRAGFPSAFSWPKMACCSSRTRPSKPSFARSTDSGPVGFRCGRSRAIRNREGVPTKEGKPWQHTTIRGILDRNAA